MTTSKVFRCLTRCFDVFVWLLLALIVAVCVTSTESARRNQVRFSDDVIVFPKENFGGVEKRSENEEYRGFFRHNEEFHKIHPELSSRRKGFSDVNRQNTEDRRSPKIDLDNTSQNISVSIKLHTDPLFLNHFTITLL